LGFATVFEALLHYVRNDEPASNPFKTAQFTFMLMVTLIMIKFILKKNRWLEENAAFMLSAAQIFFITECSICINPSEYKVSTM
jgi:hypothetical protein